MGKFEKYVNDFEDYRIPETMRAVILAGQGFENVIVKEIPVPEPGPNQLLARVDAAGVCTSLLKIIDQGANHKYLYGWDPAKWPLILGDEGSITVIKAGEALKDKYEVGKRYGLQPGVDTSPVNHLERYNNNGAGVEKIAVGYTLPGQLAEYILIQEEVMEGECLLPLKEDDIPNFAVSMAEPISCVVSSQTRHIHLYKDSPKSARRARLGIKENGVCIVVGAGAMGKIHIELAMRYKPRVLIANDLIGKRLEWVNKVLKPKADENGIRLVTATPDSMESILEEVSGGRKADDIIVAVGIREVQQKAMEWLGYGGVINLFGGLPKGDSLLTVDNIKVHYEEIKIVGSSGGDPGDYIQTIEAIRNNDIDPGNYVAAVGSIENAPRVLQMIRDNRIQGKAVLYPHLRKTGLKMVDRWSRKDEEEFLEENLV